MLSGSWLRILCYYSFSDLGLLWNLLQISEIVLFPFHYCLWPCLYSCYTRSLFAFYLLNQMFTGAMECNVDQGHKLKAKERRWGKVRGSRVGGTEGEGWRTKAYHHTLRIPWALWSLINTKKIERDSRRYGYHSYHCNCEVYSSSQLLQNRW